MRLHLGFGVGFALLLVCLVADAAAFDVSPVADAFVTSANPAGNYGGGGGIAVSAAGLPQGELQSLLRFDLAAAKASFDATHGANQWALSSAALKLTAALPGNPVFNTSDAGTIAVQWMQNDAWVEGSGTPSVPGATGVTFGTLASFLSGGDQPLGTFAFSGATSGTNTYPLTLASGLNADAAGGALASLRLLAGDANVSGVFNSRTFGVAASRPVLVLEAVRVPEPAAGVLVGGALLGMMSGRRRRC
jgi:hypothetical protein